ncbi:MAG: glycine betaine ABC transporter substrate-binding protein [Leptolyngbyaceae bacterium]|nr:glycine betaine ABC transporter substrate-binding protein [Leptolyngbyaceae bacterium]
MNHFNNRHLKSELGTSPGPSSRRRFVKLAGITGISTTLNLAFHGFRTTKAIAKPTRQSEADTSAVRMGVVGLSFYRVVGGIVQNVLESLGYRVDITEGPHAEIFPRLGRGELDMLVAVWLPNGHQTLFQTHGKQAIELGRLYDDARFFWGVPDYLPTGIQSISDLARPSVAAQMNKLIQGIGPGAGITRLSQEVMTRYQLDAAGYQFRTGTEQDWIKAFRQSVAAQQGVIVPLWQPQYLNQAFAIRRLQDPLGVFPGADRCALVVTKAFRERLPADTVNILSRIYLGVNAVTEMDYLTSLKGLSPREAATQWMNQNPDLTQSWLKPMS